MRANKKTVAVSMRRQGLEGISPAMFTPVTTIAEVKPHRIPDRVKRSWDQSAPDKVWISDVTYLRTGEGWLYLCLVTDAHTRRVLGYSLSTVQNSELIESALRPGQRLRTSTPRRDQHLGPSLQLPSTPYLLRRSATRQPRP